MRLVMGSAFAGSKGGRGQRSPNPVKFDRLQRPSRARLGDEYGWPNETSVSSCRQSKETKKIHACNKDGDNRALSKRHDGLPGEYALEITVWLNRSQI